MHHATKECVFEYFFGGGKYVGKNHFFDCSCESFSEEPSSGPPGCTITFENRHTPSGFAVTYHGGGDLVRGLSEVGSAVSFEPLSFREIHKRNHCLLMNRLEAREAREQ